MRDKNNNILKIGDNVKGSSGIEGKLTNIGGKTWIQHKNGKVLLGEVDINTIEKVEK